jgi:hypothetical protein
VTIRLQSGQPPSRTIAVILLAFFACVPLPGCSVIRQDVGQPLAADLAALTRAEDYHEVLQVLGPPHKLSWSGQGMAFLYEEVDLTERQVGLNLRAGEVVLFKAVVAREYADRRALVVTFDAQGEKRSFNYHEWSDIAGQGAALQFVFVVAGVADEGDLNDPPATHHWGFGLLKADLPSSLNRRNSLENGDSGVELKGTPTNIGQHTLELR